MKSVIQKLRKLNWTNIFSFWGIIIALGSLLVAILAWQYPVKVFNTTFQKNTVVDSSYKYADLTIISSYVTVNIKESSNNIPFQDTKVLSNYSDVTFYLPKGQQLLLYINGSYVEIILEQNIADQIALQSNGFNNNIHIRDNFYIFKKIWNAINGY